MRMYAPPGGRRASRRWTRLLSATALTTALAVALTSNQLPRTTEPMGPAAALTDVPGNGPFDFDAAERVRVDQCRLNLTLRRGGQALKALSRSGLNGTDAELRAAAESERWQDGNTPLAIAWDKDNAWRDAKGTEVGARGDVWEQSLLVPPQTTPPGYTVAGFEWVYDKENPYYTTGYMAGIGALYFGTESDIYLTDQTPVASRESVNAVNAIAAARYSEDRFEDGPALDALKWDMTFTHPMYADDARIFLQHGGFPTTAPEPGTMEFRLDVEALKARFASCTTHNPLDPYDVLDAEVIQASVEWKDELSGQKSQRAVIMDAEAKASRHLGVASQAMAEALGQSLIASRLTDWQAHWLKQAPSSTMFYPTAAEFAEVKTNIARARERAQGRVFVAGRAALAAQQEAARADEAKIDAYAVADAAGLPRGRGLMYGQQAVQVAKASAAAAQAAFKATETAANATRASAADSKTLMALAETQAHASKAEFRRKAAEEAEAQAKAAAEGAAYQAKLAADNAAKAKEAENRVKAAEAEAKAAAADAAAKRKKAEAEAAYAKSQKELADAERAKAGTARAKADAERQVAADKLAAAQTAGATAATKKDEALAAERNAVRARDNAITAEGRRDAMEAKAYALEARAEADEGTDAAAASRTAATQARTAANEAGTAAANARTAADSATTASANARAAATRAEGAAKRAQAAADAAKRDVAITEAAVAKATAATADAIDAADQAKWNAITAKALAATAREKAAEAKGHADVARHEAAAAVADSVRAAGFAYATAQAAAATRSSAQQVIKPANDAIELGSPYADSDPSAGLAVLIGQSSKTHAEQQAALAKAKSAQAAAAAAEAKALAARATADAKAAAEAAARSAEHAAAATASAEAAQASANAAAKSVEAAKQSLARTVEYHEQAKADAEAAQGAANSAGEYAAQADAAASEAEKDAGAARDSATAAENDAGTASSVATQAEQDATEAEESAGRADEAADEAEDAATRAENAKSQESISTGGATGIGGVFTRQNIEQIGEPQPQNVCELGIGFDGCTVKFKLTFNVIVDFYLCQDPDAGENPTAANCPTEATTWLGSQRFDNQVTYIDRYFTRWEIVIELDKAFLKTVWFVLTDDFVQCSKGSVSGCLWAASNFIPGKKIADAVDLIRALDAAMNTGVGVADAYRALKNLDLDPQIMASITREVNLVEDALAACTTNSFLGETPVVMADGSTRPISGVQIGDLVLAADPDSGEHRGMRVSSTFRHETKDLVEVRLVDGSAMVTTPGHKVHVVGRGWTLAMHLRPDDLVIGADRTAGRVASVRDRDEHAALVVYDLTVEGLHTFFVGTRGATSRSVLVHNCLNLLAHESPTAGHTIADHVRPTGQAAIDLAKEKLRKNPDGPGINSVWNDLPTAQAAVDEAMKKFLTGGSEKQNAKNRKRLKDWMAATPKDSSNPLHLLSFKVRLDTPGSLGTVYRHDGDIRKAGNTVAITLQRTGMPKHGGYIVYTASPE
ncbi:polymorphic toxin-type HINT domain-containing protein [Streptomyces sp. NPDC001930]|uniref:polymorphic toxin-type HINT domain-containing protein n=1 Tax=Streptomyces sp. NPDC001930 TaxID=3364625 RepID=UPI0036A2A328